MVLQTPRGGHFPIIRDGITSSLPLLVAVGILIYYLLPLWMQKRSPIDVRPFMLIYSGILFGIYGGGFILSLLLTSMGRETITCGREIDDLKDYVIAYCGFAFFMVKFMDFGRIIFATLRKKETQTSVLNFLQISLLILLIQSGVYFHPGGVAYFIGAVDSFLGCFINSYYILASAKCFKDAGLWKKKTGSAAGHGICRPHDPWCRLSVQSVMQRSKAVSLHSSIVWCLVAPFLRVQVPQIPTPVSEEEFEEQVGKRSQKHMAMILHHCTSLVSCGSLNLSMA